MGFPLSFVTHLQGHFTRAEYRVNKGNFLLQNM